LPCQKNLLEKTENFSVSRQHLLILRFISTINNSKSHSNHSLCRPPRAALLRMQSGRTTWRKLQKHVRW